MEPYLASADLRGEYLYSKAISPFFVGGGIALSIGFPRKDFPSNYKIGGEYVDAPKLLSATVYAPAGYSFSPWNNSVQLITEIKIGARITSVALLSGGYIIGEPVYSFFASGGAGVMIKFFEITANCEYDTVGKVSPSLYAGACIKWGNKK